MQRTLTLPANGTYTARVTASVFAVISATAAFDIETDRDGKRTVAADRKLGSPGGRKFKRVTFYETSGADNTIMFYIGDDDYVSSGASITTGAISVAGKDAPTYTKAYISTALASGATWTFTGLDAGKQRQSIIISNNSAVVLQVKDNAGNIGGYIQPNTPFPLFTNGVVKVTNPSGGAANVAVIETFYL